MQSKITNGRYAAVDLTHSLGSIKYVKPDSTNKIPIEIISEKSPLVLFFKNNFAKKMIIDKRIQEKPGAYIHIGSPVVSDANACI